MTNIDDSNNTPASTPPGYWFGEIEGRLRDRMRDALAEQGLRRGGWRLLHSLSEGPATAAELADRLPRGRRGHGLDRSSGHGAFGRGRDHDRSGTPERGVRGERRPGREGFGRGGFDPRERAGFDPRDGGGRHPYPHPRAQAAWTYSRETWRAERPFGPGGGRPDRHDADSHAETHGHDGPRGHEHHEHHDREAAFERGFERGFLRGSAAAPAFGGPFGGPFGGAFGGAGGFRGGRGFGPHRGHGGPQARCGGDRRTARIERILADFTERGWVWFDGDRATLTDEGRAAHDAAFVRIQEVRGALADGISDEDYATTLATLETMARNLGWEPREQDADGGPEQPGQAKS